MKQKQQQQQQQQQPGFIAILNNKITNISVKDFDFIFKRQI